MPRAPLYEKTKAVLDAYDRWQSSNDMLGEPYRRFEACMEDLRTLLAEIDETLAILEDIRGRNLASDG